MPSYPIFQLDAFTDRPFGGNPAAYVPLADWPEDALLAAIAAENNLAETAYTVRADDRDGVPVYALRWFTPAVEVDLCGHATLATAAHLFERDHSGADTLVFTTRSGDLTVERARGDDPTGPGGGFVLDFPAQMPERITAPDGIGEILGAEPIAAWAKIDHLYVFDHADTVRALQPDLRALARLDTRGVIVTAPSDDDPGLDFVSRFFAPQSGIDEDPVTGSAHTKLVPYWAARLNRSVLRCAQVSARRGDLWCELRGERVRMRGHAVRYLEGTITVP